MRDVTKSDPGRISRLLAALGVCAGLVAVGRAGELSIRDIQYSADPDGDSPYAGQIIDCGGGICVGKYPGSRPRLILQDPRFPDGWAGIQVKDWTGGALFDHVSLGDWVALRNVLVEEFRGTTYLQWQAVNNPEFTIVSEGNPLPPPLDVSVSEIPAPLYNPDDDGWYVADHAAEPYESMRLRVRDVTVTALDLGKAVDNYELEDADGHRCWATDYMNQDRGPSGYHPFVVLGRYLCGVSGVFEQYTYLPDGWDYYQLVTLSSADLAICGDVNHDGGVDLTDLAQLLANYGLSGGATYEDGDLDYDGDVDLADLAALLSFYGSAAP